MSEPTITDEAWRPIPDFHLRWYWQAHDARTFVGQVRAFFVHALADLPDEAELEVSDDFQFYRVKRWYDIRPIESGYVPIYGFLIPDIPPLRSPSYPVSRLSQG